MMCCAPCLCTLLTSVVAAIVFYCLQLCALYRSVSASRYICLKSFYCMALQVGCNIKYRLNLHIEQKLLLFSFNFHLYFCIIAASACTGLIFST